MLAEATWPGHQCMMVGGLKAGPSTRLKPHQKEADFVYHLFTNSQSWPHAHQALGLQPSGREAHAEGCPGEMGANAQAPCEP